MTTLILLHSDGFVEAYSDGAVLILNVPATQSQMAERLAEELIELSIPEPYRKIYDAKHLAMTENTRSIHIDQIIQAKDVIKTMRKLDAIGGLEDAVDITTG